MLGGQLQRNQYATMERYVLNNTLMWNKDQNQSSPTTPPSGAPAAARPVSMPDAAFSGTGAIIGETMRIKGDVYSKEELQIDGEVQGKLESESRLTVGPKGKADANIKAAEVIVIGTIKGNVEAVQRIVLRKGANLVGDVKTAGIVIEDGAYFKGGIDIARPEDAQKSSKSAGAR
jgi:cytoskeletal protein CcmA (bactofilin family)